MVKNPPKDHHYIPKFWLKQWTASDGKLWRYTRVHDGRLAADRVGVGALGFKPFLYETPGLPADQAQRIESGFMQRLDDDSAVAHQKLLSNVLSPWVTKERSDWSRFVMSLWFRTPRNLKSFKDGAAAMLANSATDFEESWRAVRQEGWPVTLAEALEIDPFISEQAAMLILPRAIDNERLGEMLNNMTWAAVEVVDVEEKFVISDAPMIFQNGLAQINGSLIMPISPSRLFVAYNDVAFKERLDGKSGAELVRMVNTFIAGAATHFVGADNNKFRDRIDADFGTLEEFGPAQSLATQGRS